MDDLSPLYKKSKVLLTLVKIEEKFRRNKTLQNKLLIIEKYSDNIKIYDFIVYGQETYIKSLYKKLNIPFMF